LRGSILSFKLAEEKLLAMTLKTISWAVPFAREYDLTKISIGIKDME